MKIDFSSYFDARRGYPRRAYRFVKRQPHAKRGDKKLKLWTEKVSNDKIEVATNRNKKSKENPWMN